MKKLSKRYVGYVVKKSMRYVKKHPADFIRIGIMAGVVLSSGDSCFAAKVEQVKGFEKVSESLNNGLTFVTHSLGGLMAIGGTAVVGVNLVKGENRDLIGKGAGVAGGGALMYNADSLVENVTGCLM